jgi:hypothetical protein
MRSTPFLQYSEGSEIFKEPWNTSIEESSSCPLLEVPAGRNFQWTLAYMFLEEHAPVTLEHVLGFIVVLGHGKL